MSFAFELREELEARGLIWYHDGNPLRPHVVLSSGNHASACANIREYLTDPRALVRVAGELRRRLRKKLGPEDARLTRVMGSGNASITLVAELARQFCACGRKVLSAFTEKATAPDGSVTMVCNFLINPGERIVMVEDVQTTGHTTEASIRAIRDVQPSAVILPITAAVVAWNNPLQCLPGFELIALLEDCMKMWTPEQCKESGLCSIGSTAIKPKTPSNWALLTKEYTS